MIRRCAPLVPAFALLAVACQDVQQPPADFQVSDGSAFGGHGNPHFYFLPPLVPSPEYSGIFDPHLLPYLSIQVWGPFDTEGEAECGGPLHDTFDEARGLQLEATAERYAYGWDTPKSLRKGKIYRLCVSLSVAGAPVATLGFRDLSPTQGGGSVAEAPVYLFNAGSNLPIKFRVEEGVLNAALCAGAGGSDYDCTAALLTEAGDEAVCVGSTCSLTSGGLTEPTLFLVERLPCYGGDPAIPEGHEPDGQGVNWLAGLDLPQYAGCLQITVFDPAWDGFSTDGVVGACFFDDSGPPLAAEQDESLRLHLQQHGMQTVVALDRVPAADALEAGQCHDIYAAAPPPPGSGVGARLAWQVRRGLRTAQRALNPWFAPPDALAFHTGFGGHTSLNPPPDEDSGPGFSVAGETAGPVVQFHVTEGGAKVYLLAWALVSQMEKYQLGGTDGVVAPEPLTVNVGVPVAVKVKVTDNGETSSIDPSSCVPDPQGGEICGYQYVDPRPVKKALVHFSATNDATVSAESVLTTADQLPYGIAEIQVTATRSGTSFVTASGYGIGARPATGFGGFVPPPDGEIALLPGSLTFEIFACDNDAAGFIGPSVGGGLDAEWQDAQFKQVIAVNLGGNVASTADLYVGHDCENLYLALAVGADAASNNALRFVFDNDGDGAEEIGDNVISLTRNAGGGWDYRDRYLSADCVGSKQADCGPQDPVGLRHGEGDAAPDDGKFVYEFRFPLASGDAAHDFQRKLGNSLGFYLAVHLGTGSKGNTEWPDQKGNFKTYHSYTLTQY